MFAWCPFYLGSTVFSVKIYIYPIDTKCYNEMFCSRVVIVIQFLAYGTRISESTWNQLENLILHPMKDGSRALTSRFPVHYFCTKLMKGKALRKHNQMQVS